MFDGLAGIDVSRYLLAIGVVGLGLSCLFGVLWFIRKKPSSPFVRGGRARQPRLAVVDATAVDTRRRLVLVRRDNVEHLIMIGGPTDIVIESRIAEDLDTKPGASELPFEQPTALPKADAALELPAPPLAVTEQPVSASVQAQSAPPLKAKMWPTEPKKVSEPVPVEPSDSKAAAEPLAFQPSAQVKTAPETPVKMDRVATPDRGQSSSNLASNLAFAKSEAAQKEPDLEIRNPYLEAETSAPAPVRSERPSSPAPAPAPVSALHSWLRPAKVEAPATLATKEPAALPSAKIVPLATQSVSAGPVATKPVSNPPIDVDSLISGDFLDNARSRVLESPSDAPVAPEVSLQNMSFADKTAKKDVPATGQSQFAKMLDDEIKTGLPESRFDKPQIDPFLADIANLGSAYPAPRSEPSTGSAAEVDAQQAKTIADILDGARARVLEPEPDAVAPTLATAPPAAAVMESPKKQPVDTADLISDAFAIEFEKLWDSKTPEPDPVFALDTGAETPLRAPDVTLPASNKRLGDDLDAFGSHLQLDPKVQSPNPKTVNKAVDPELSLDDEMARVLGEFSATRKN